MATFALVLQPSTSTPHCFHDHISTIGLASVLGTVALAGTLLLDWQQRNSVCFCNHDSLLVASANQKFADLFGSEAHFEISSCENKGFFRIEVDIDCFPGMLRAERERRVSQLCDDVLGEHVKEIEIIWRFAQKCSVSEADTEIDSEGESESEEEEAASISSTFQRGCDDASETFIDAEGVLDGTGICSGLVAKRRMQIVTPRDRQFRPADTWQIRQGMVPELRKQWSRGNVDN